MLHIYSFADRIIRLEDGRLTNEWKRDADTRKGTRSPVELPHFLQEQYA